MNSNAFLIASNDNLQSISQNIYCYVFCLVISDQVIINIRHEIFRSYMPVEYFSIVFKKSNFVYLNQS